MGGYVTEVRGIEVVHWNPLRARISGPLGRILPKRPVNNFGDVLSPLVVERLALTREFAPVPRRLLAIGSILHFAADGDVVWGTGINGKIPLDEVRARRLDVRAVRGPLTASWLRSMGVEVPGVYGDPGLLAPSLLKIKRSPRPLRGVTIVPNLYDIPRWRRAKGFLDPRNDIETVVRSIAESERVVASSLHGLVIADALGIPASLLQAAREPLFKYEDYYEGTGRRLPHVSSSLEEALDNPAPPLDTDLEALTNAFPADLWGVEHKSR